MAVEEVKAKKAAAVAPVATAAGGRRGRLSALASSLPRPLRLIATMKTKMSKVLLLACRLLRSGRGRTGFFSKAKKTR